MRALLALLALTFAVPAQAQSLCGKYADFVKTLSDRYNETSIGKGMSGGGPVVIELFTSAETFTILATVTATGNSCIIAAGKGWALVETIPGTDT
jgi:hypothetical protein